MAIGTIGLYLLCAFFTAAQCYLNEKHAGIDLFALVFSLVLGSIWVVFYLYAQAKWTYELTLQRWWPMEWKKYQAAHEGPLQGPSRLKQDSIDPQ